MIDHLPFRNFDLLSRNQFLDHCESRGIFITALDFEDLCSKNIIISIKGQYPKYLAYEIWKYRRDSVRKLYLVADRDKALLLHTKWHRAIMDLVYQTNDYIMAVQKGLRATIKDILDDKDLTEREAERNIISVIKDHHRENLINLHDDAKNILAELVSPHSLEEFYIYRLIDDIWELKGNLNFFEMRRFSRNLENLSNVEKIRPTEYRTLDSSSRLAQDCWNTVVIMKWLMEDYSGRKIDLGNLCAFCGEPLFPTAKKVGRPTRYHFKEENPECFRRRMNFLKRKSRARRI